MKGISISGLLDKELTIGAFFTPVQWGKFAIKQFDIYQKWLNGATVFDPTMGEGNLLESLIIFGIEQGRKLSELPTSNLFGNEINTEFFNNAILKFKTRYGLDMTNNFTNKDFLNLKGNKFDIIFGNPPWQNYVDLPEAYKEQIKSYFFQYDLVGNSQNLLFGSSRIDIAALIIQIAIKDFLNQNGEAIFFMPLSLLLNDGANRNFRSFSIGDINYSLETVFDFSSIGVFEGVSTRYGLSKFVRDKQTCYPISYFIAENGKWNEYMAKPVFQNTDPLSIFSKENAYEFDLINPIVIKKESTPRQGINTCGANDIFFFDQYEELDNDFVQVSNKRKGNVVLPKQFLFPLITSKDFKTEYSIPAKWVLLPYNPNGKPLEKEQIQKFPDLENYLNENMTILQKRKGTMLGALLKRSYWWALLGVGVYSFFPFKIVWEAYGKKTFRPKIFKGHWQVNQSLQAYIPVRTLAEAGRIHNLLQDKKIENYLLSLKMEGTMNWAQPGKIKKLIKYEEECLRLF